MVVVVVVVVYKVTVSDLSNFNKTANIIYKKLQAIHLMLYKR